MSEWRQIARRELHRYREQTGQDVIERQDLLDQALPVLEREFPDAETPGQTLSRVLQELRDRGELQFLSPGVYRIRDLEVEQTAADEKTDDEPYTAREYETTVGARSLPAAFRQAVIERYEATCPVSGVDHEGLLDVAHVLPWSDFPDFRTDPGNVLLLSKTHHAAFDRGLFTLDPDFRLHVDPEFRTGSEVLRRTLVDREDERVPLPDTAGLSPEHLSRHNARLEWW